jgi:hypothetical protein
VKLLRRNDTEIVFHFGKREKEAFSRLISHYPMVTSSALPFSKFADLEDLGVDKELLDQSFAEAKNDSKRMLTDMLDGGNHFTEMSRGWQLKLTPDEVTWLLQIFGDIRVGCWMRLGCPDEQKGKMPELTQDNLEFYMAMEMCGRIQMLLLYALRYTGD